MQTTTNIKLTYFNVRGRAEPARLILAQAGVDYEDIRIEREDWPKYKSSKIFCAIRINEIEGKTKNPLVNKMGSFLP